MYLLSDKRRTSAYTNGANYDMAASATFGAHPTFILILNLIATPTSGPGPLTFDPSFHVRYMQRAIKCHESRATFSSIWTLVRECYA